MIISDRRRFVYVHIPKCAGTTLRRALAAFDEHGARFHDKAVSRHPEIGLLDHHHIPLAVLRAHFPEDFERVVAYRAFSMVRDPFARFPSSLHERFVQRDRRALEEINVAEIAREADAVMEWLARRPDDEPITDPEFIHFSRQRDYVFVEDEQVVDSLYTVDAIADLMRDISGVVGRPIRIEDSVNRRREYAFPAMRRLQGAVTAPIEAILPEWLWRPAYRPVKWALRVTGLTRPAGDALAALPNEDAITAFIREFYADDIRLFDSVKRGRAT